MKEFVEIGLLHGSAKKEVVDEEEEEEVDGTDDDCFLWCAESLVVHHCGMLLCVSELIPSSYYSGSQTYLFYSRHILQINKIPGWLD